MHRVLLVADPGLVDAGYVAHAVRLLDGAGIDVSTFTEFGPNPDSDMAEKGRDAAARFDPGRDRRPWRRQLARLRESRQLPADERRDDGRLPRLRQGRASLSSR